MVYNILTTNLSGFESPTGLFRIGKATTKPLNVGVYNMKRESPKSSLNARIIIPCTTSRRAPPHGTCLSLLFFNPAGSRFFLFARFPASSSWSPPALLLQHGNSGLSPLRFFSFSALWTGQKGLELMCFSTTRMAFSQPPGEERGGQGGAVYG